MIFCLGQKIMEDNSHGKVFHLVSLDKSSNPETKTPALSRARGFSSAEGLAVTYFRMRLHTIIGANPFHGPVRDGKAWVQAAVAARLKGGRSEAWARDCAKHCQPFAVLTVIGSSRTGN